MRIHDAEERDGGITVGENLGGDQAHTLIARLGKLRPEAIQDQTDKHRGSICGASSVVLVFVGPGGEKHGE